jgi:hypothetical protein
VALLTSCAVLFILSTSFRSASFEFRRLFSDPKHSCPSGTSLQTISQPKLVVQICFHADVLALLDLDVLVEKLASAYVEAQHCHEISLH